MFKRGYKEVEKKKKEQEKQAEQRQFGLFDFFIKGDGETAEVRFLTEEPVNWMGHTVTKNINGKTIYTDVPCTEDENCSRCKTEEKNARPLGTYLVVDLRPYTYKDSTGKEQTRDYQVKLYTRGTTDLVKLGRYSDKYGLTNRNYEITRMGTGKSTSYDFERGDEEKLTSEEIEELLPENLREKFDGTMDSLYAIVEEQLENKMEDQVEDSDEEDEESEVDTRTVNIEDEEEEKEEKKPLKKSKPRVKSLLKKK